MKNESMKTYDYYVEYTTQHGEYEVGYVAVPEDCIHNPNDVASYLVFTLSRQDDGLDAITEWGLAWYEEPEDKAYWEEVKNDDLPF